MAQALREVVRNHFREKLAAGRVVSKLSVRIARSVEIVHIAKSCGFDALYIDMQHSSISLETTSQLCIAALAIGISDRKLVAEYVKLGARIVATGTDVSMLMELGTERAKFVAGLNSA